MSVGESGQVSVVREAAKIYPSVLIDGQTVYPEGWMFVLALALHGDSWSVKLVEDPEYDLRGKIRDYERRRERYNTEKEIAELEERITELEHRIAGLRKSLEPGV